jgi:hypothetical protein
MTVAKHTDQAIVISHSGQNTAKPCKNFSTGATVHDACTFKISSKNAIPIGNSHMHDEPT